MAYLIRFSGISGSGKTSLIQQILSNLNALGISTACIKHSHHKLDLPPKDSSRLFEASSDGAIVIGENAISITLPLQSKTPQEWVDFLFPDTDIVIVEGWRKFDLPTILLNSILPKDWSRPKTIIATVGKQLKNSSIPCYETPVELSDFILKQCNHKP